ncbi:unannotated protein [freshwater metagenome]|uniref:Unannotated protein n=1 Tax=freshwater metagenome TaxID=449393 RepID=A0A6J7PJ64_9ZZZZ
MDHAANVEACGLGEVEPFGQRLAQADDADLVRHLGELTGARLAHQHHAGAVGGDYRSDPIEGGLVATDHHRQRAVAGTVDTTRHRRVEEHTTVFGDLRRHTAGGLGRSGGVVEPHRALRHDCGDPVGNGFEFTVGGQRTDHEFAIDHSVGGVRGGSAAVFGHPAIGDSGGHIAHGDLMPGRGQVGGDVPAHVPDADDGDAERSDGRVAHAGTPGLPRSANVKPPARRACTRPPLAIARITTISSGLGPSGTPTSIAS